MKMATYGSDTTFQKAQTLVQSLTKSYEMLNGN